MHTLLYEIKLVFFESPNFSLCSDGEEIILGRVNSESAARIFCKAYVLESLKSMGEEIVNLDDLSQDGPWKVEYDRDNAYLTLFYGDAIAQIYKIEMVCPACGVNPNSLGDKANKKFCFICNRQF